MLQLSDQKSKKRIVRSGIRTHAHRSGLRPERSALDRSAILTYLPITKFKKPKQILFYNTKETHQYKKMNDCDSLYELSKSKCFISWSVF